MDWHRRAKGRSSRAWRFAGLAGVGLVAGLVGAFALVPLAAHALVAGINLALDACVWLTVTFEAKPDPWAVLVEAARAAARALATPRALSVLGALVLMSSLALYGLQRLLGPEEESRDDPSHTTTV